MTSMYKRFAPALGTKAAFKTVSYYHCVVIITYYYLLLLLVLLFLGEVVLYGVYDQI